MRRVVLGVGVGLWPWLPLIPPLPCPLLPHRCRCSVSPPGSHKRHWEELVTESHKETGRQSRPRQGSEIGSPLGAGALVGPASLTPPCPVPGMGWGEVGRFRTLVRSALPLPLETPISSHIIKWPLQALDLPVRSPSQWLALSAKIWQWEALRRLRLWWRCSPVSLPLFRPLRPVSGTGGGRGGPSQILVRNAWPLP